MEKTKNSYKKSGVNIELANTFVNSSFVDQEADVNDQED